MAKQSELDQLPRYVFAAVGVGILLVALNVIFVYQLSHSTSILERKLVGIHLPSTSHLNNLLVEIREIQFLKKVQLADGPKTQNDVDELLLQHFYVVDQSVDALHDLHQLNPNSIFAAPERNMLLRYNNWLATRSPWKEFAEIQPAQTNALERFRLGVAQLHKLHLQQIRELSLTVYEANRKQTSKILSVVISSVLVGGVIIGRLLQLLFTALRKHREDESHLRQYQERLEEMVSDRTDELKQLLEETESFNYSVSHDLRSPLRAIDGFSQALVEDTSGKLSQMEQHYLHRIRAAAQRMGELIDDLLSLSRISRTEINSEPVSLCEIAQEVVNALRQHHPKPPIEFTCDVAEPVIGDRRLLLVVLENLLGNARKYSSRRDCIEISIGTHKRDHETVYFVQDNGTGFDLKFANKLFKPFHRLHTDPDFEGSGIGLATVQRAIHRHTGRVWAKSSPDEGATFFFTLGDQLIEESPPATQPRLGA